MTSHSMISTTMSSVSTRPYIAPAKARSTAAAGSAAGGPDAVVLRAFATAVPALAPQPGPGGRGVLALPIAIDGGVTEVLAFSI